MPKNKPPIKLTGNHPTDWDSYYQKPSYLSKFTRPITSSLLIRSMFKYCPIPSPSIIEIGGGNSCFADQLIKDLKTKSYTIVDNNELAVKQFKDRFVKRNDIDALCEDILSPNTIKRADIVFSVGLVEHFSELGTEKAIKNHFEYVEEGGLVVISFPTPTWMYKFIRWFAEITGSWAFPDERPLLFSEVLEACQERGDVISCFTNWKIGLTQGVVVVKKKSKKL